MSEKEPSQQEKVLKLLEEQNEKLGKVATLLEKQQTSLEQSTMQKQTTSDSGKPHKTLEEIANCLNCKGHYKVDEYNAKLEKEWTKKERENPKLFPDICDPSKGGCGLGVDHQKEETCPNCGKTEARKR